MYDRAGAFLGLSWDLGFVMFVACKLEGNSRVLPTTDWHCYLRLTRFGKSGCSGKYSNKASNGTTSPS